MLSLNARIFAAIAAVCAIALIGVGLYSSRMTLMTVEHLSAGPDSAARTSMIRDRLQTYAATHHGFDNVEPLVERLGRTSNARILLLTPDWHIIATSLGSRTARVARVDADTIRVTMLQNGERDEVLLRGGVPVDNSNGSTIAKLFVFGQPLAPPNGLSVARSSNRALWTAVAIALLATLAVSILLSRYIVAPVRNLTSAATAMSRGDLKRRVEVQGTGDLAKLATSFNNMADAVERIESLRRRMVTDVAHELRSPLTRMRVQIEAAQDAHVDTAIALSAIRNETLALERLVDDLRDLTLADAGKLHLEKRPVSLHACIDDALAQIASEAAARDITIVRDVTPLLPPIEADSGRIRQILANLLDNALRYSADGGHIVVGAAEGEGFAEFFVQDDGPGIPESDLRFVFERFYRVDGSRARATGGSGLGLAIAKELTEAQGGTIAAESTTGEGSRFTCRFPAA